MSEPTPIPDNPMLRRAGEILTDIYIRNEEFNEDLDQIATIDIPGRSKPLRLSEAIFWADPTGYNEELRLWQERAVETSHEPAIKILEDNDQLGLFAELVEAVQRNRIAPFIGAGMSSDSGFPSWEASLLEICQKIESPPGVEDLIKSEEYLDAANALWSADETQVVNYIRSKFAASKVKRGEISGAILLLDKISTGCIITTNFDRVIEAIIPHLDGYMHGRQPGHNFVANLLRGNRCLLKLHGDTDNRDSYVFTRQQYDDAYGAPFDFTRPLSKALRQIYISHSLLFLGCGMSKDRTLELFQHVHDLEHFDTPDHFAFLPEPSVASVENRVQKETRLLKLNVRPIWYPEDKHDYVEKLLNLAIDCAKKRYSL